MPNSASNPSPSTESETTLAPTAPCEAAPVDNAECAPVRLVHSLEAMASEADALEDREGCRRLRVELEALFVNEPDTRTDPELIALRAANLQALAMIHAASARSRKDPDAGVLQLLQQSVTLLTPLAIRYPDELRHTELLADAHHAVGVYLLAYPTSWREAERELQADLALRHRSDSSTAMAVRELAAKSQCLSLLARIRLVHAKDRRRGMSLLRAAARSAREAFTASREAKK